MTGESTKPPRRAAPTGLRPSLFVRAAPWLSMGVALLLLAATLVLAAIGQRAASSLDRATLQSLAVADSRVALAQLRAEDRAYAAQPGPPARARVNQRSTALSAAIDRLGTLGLDADTLSVIDLRAAVSLYTLAITHHMAAVDAGSHELVDAIDAAEITPSFTHLAGLLEADSSRLQAQARGLASFLHGMLLGTLFAAPVLVLVGIAAMAVFWRTHRAGQRRHDAARERQAAADLLIERRYRGLVQHSPDMMLLCDAAGLVGQQNLAAWSVWRHPAHRLLGQSVLELVHAEDQPAIRQFWEQLAPAADDAPTRVLDLRIADGDGRWRDAELTAVNLLGDVAVNGVLVTVHDIARRKAFERQLTEYATLDPQTHLPNQLLFGDRLDQAVARARRARTGVGVLLLDMTDPGGRPQLRDDLLIDAAARLQTCVRTQDTVARLAGSRLALVLEDVRSDSDLLPVADRLREQFTRPFTADGRTLLLRWSAGMALGQPGRDSAHDLVRNAELALAQAVGEASGHCVIFGSDMQSRSLDRVELLADLRAAEVPAEMVVHFQPVVTLATGQLRGVEALVRWLHPVHGLIAARDFMMAAEETGIIVPLGRWVLDSGCRQVAAWQAAFDFDPPLTLDVNISERQLTDPSLLASVERALQGSHLAPAQLVLDIRESALLDNTQRSLDTLWALKRMGVRVALDNFGTGGIAVPVLKQLPLDMLKIDGSFVRNLGHDPDDTTKVQASIALGHSLGLMVSGDGVETDDQAAQLAAWQCGLGQGHLYGRPADARATEAMLTEAMLQGRAPPRAPGANADDASALA